MKNGCPLFTALFIDGSGGNVTIVVCRAVGDGWLADRLPVWMGHKGCGSGQRSGARPTTLSPIYTSGPLPNHQPQLPDILK